MWENKTIINKCSIASKTATVFAVNFDPPNGVG